MKKLNTKIGTIFSWYDYTKPKKNKAEGTVTYSQSNTVLDKYNQRYIGLFMDHSDNIYIAVAVNKKNDSGNWWRFILENRIEKAIRTGNIDESDKGVTFVPFRYKDLLYTDPYTYNNLYGCIDPTYLSLAVKEAMAANTQKIDSYVQARADRQ